MTYALKHPLCAVEKPDGALTKGGSQNLSGYRSINLVGCGIVGAAELIIYLCRYHGCSCPELTRNITFSDKVSPKEYDILLKKISSRYLPIIPRAGINGVELAAGVNLIFRKYSLPYKARWGVRLQDLYAGIEDMLSKDLPVIIAVGPNFPKFWENNRLDMYCMRNDGTLEKASSVKGHFMIVTGLDGDTIKVSSWGREFYIKRSEYDRYIADYSNSIVCNILHIEDKT